MSDGRLSHLAMRLASDPDQEIQLLRVEAREELSAHFHITADFLTTTEIKPQLLQNLGIEATITLLSEEEHARYYNGVVVDIETIDIHADQPVYRLTLVPAMYLHQHSRNFRIFQDRSLIDIVTTVLGDRNVKHQIKAQKGTRLMPYCVQYGESDHDFVSRLLEEEGLYYFYLHSNGQHVMVICDDANQSMPYRFGFTVNPSSSGIDRTDGKMGEFVEEKTFLQAFHERVATGGEEKVSLRNFDFMQPADAVASEFAHKSGHQQETIEFYDWPGRYYEKREGNDLAKTMLEARQALRWRFDGLSQWPGIETGRTMKVEYPGHDLPEKEYLVIATHTVTATETVRSDMGGGVTQTRFTAIPSKIPFRAMPRSVKPVVPGPQSAKVTGPYGEEINVDKHGRVTVQFLWDRSGVKDDNSSCWIRVAQTSHLGTMIIPRIGKEVLVDFIGGDPDRPVIVGCLYNADDRPHYSLPEHKTRQVWRSKSHKLDLGNGKRHKDALSSPSGMPAANEIHFEDKTGEEEIYVHAEKDLRVVVRNDKTETVCRDHKFTIRRDQTGTIERDDTLTVKGEQNITVEENQTEHVKKIQKVTADQKMHLICGESSIVLEPTSITIKSPTITLDGVTAVDIKAPMGTFKCSATLTLQGGLVKIN